MFNKDEIRHVVIFAADVLEMKAFLEWVCRQLRILAPAPTLAREPGLLVAQRLLCKWPISYMDIPVA